MTKPNECYAYFAVKDLELDPSALTAQLRVAPYDSWAKGDLSPSRRERTFGLWSLRSRLPMTAELEDHVRDVLMQMDANPEAFLAVSTQYSGYMQLVGEFHEIGVGLHFTQDVLARLAHYRLALDFDAYYLYSDSRECTD